jgi:hypothetical protein
MVLQQAAAVLLQNEVNSVTSPGSGSALQRRLQTPGGSHLATSLTMSEFLGSTLRIPLEDHTKVYILNNALNMADVSQIIRMTRVPGPFP